MNFGVTGTRLVQNCTHNLKFDGLAIQLNGADLEVNPNGTNVALCVGVVLEKYIDNQE